MGGCQGQPFPTTDLLDIPLAAIAYESNNLIQARTLALQGREAQRRLHQELLIGLECEQILILASAGLGDWEEAQGLIRRDTQLDHTWSWFVPHIAMLDATIQLRRGEIETAGRWAKKVQLYFKNKPDELRETWYFTYVRVLLAQENYQEAQQLLSQLEIQVQAGGRYARLITVRILQALAAAALANEEAANRLLAEAVQLAAPDNYLRRFLDEGPMVATLVPSVRSVAPAFVDNLTQAFGHNLSKPSMTVASTHDFPHSSLPESLTRQELKVLRLLNEGFSSEGVAERLVISESTAKWHIHNIYVKLGVKDRSGVIAQARKIGLL